MKDIAGAPLYGRDQAVCMRRRESGEYRTVIETTHDTNMIDSQYEQSSCTVYRGSSLKAT